MRGIVMVLLAFIAGRAADQGYLTVTTDRPGLAVYLDGEFAGSSPVEKRSVAPGEHTVGLFHPDTIDNAFWQLRQSGLMTMIVKTAELRRFDLGTKRVVVAPGETKKVFLSMAAAQRAPSRTCCLAAGCSTGAAAALFLAGFLLAWFVPR